VFVADKAERDERYPELGAGSGRASSFTVLPLAVEGAVTGVLALGFEEEDFGDDTRRFLSSVAELCAQALDRARLYDNERRARSQAESDKAQIQHLAQALQTSLLPPQLPDVPGADLAARYLPALSGVEVGGDFYDVFDTGGDWALVIGDVCGKGPDAAAITAIARYTLRSVAMDMRQPAAVLRKLNDALIHQQLDEKFCTVAYGRAVASARGMRITVCRGGHPSPMVVRADGEVTPVGSAGGLIGALPDIRLWEETVQLEAGDAIVFYTDGVTEARAGRDQFGEERVAETLSRCAGRPAAEIAEQLERAVIAFGGDEPGDDIAILVLRVTP
jgi:sigma-B regulation protein RsbU (phosphoserine phosphatase)